MNTAIVGSASALIVIEQQLSRDGTIPSRWTG
jgi:hypothetical protein